MICLFLLSECQMARISPYFFVVSRRSEGRRPAGCQRHRYVIRNGLQWKDAPFSYGPHKTLYKRFIHCSRLGVFDRIIAALASEARRPSAS